MIVEIRDEKPQLTTSQWCAPVRWRVTPRLQLTESQRREEAARAVLRCPALKVTYESQGRRERWRERGSNKASSFCYGGLKLELRASVARAMRRV
ncbi:hypothetical protein L3X38_024185 [Prunus dulcis]|uniref:Uncharacterized protein n=1 Tax=Prunus dulcis TaxID=3755 RepID=A0AAD4W216_PRUDU|nr:hypothetical protein L3X38_024185 [Prunus dulcis]